MTFVVISPVHAGRAWAGTNIVFGAPVYYYYYFLFVCPHLEDIMMFIHVVLEEYTSLATTSAEGFMGPHPLYVQG